MFVLHCNRMEESRNDTSSVQTSFRQRWSFEKVATNFCNKQQQLSKLAKKILACPFKCNVDEDTGNAFMFFSKLYALLHA